MKESDRQSVTQYLIAALFCVLFLAACQERDLYQGENEEELDIENLFDFSTAQTVTLDVKYDVAAQTQLNIEVYTQNPLMVSAVGNKVKDASIDPAFTGLTDKGGQVSCTVNIPDAAKKLYLYSPNAVAPTLVVGDIVNGKVTIANVTEYGDVPTRMAVSTRASTSGTYYKNWPVKDVTAGIQLGGWDDNEKPNYLLANKMTLSDEYRAKIDRILPAENNMDATTFSYQILTLKEDANVEMFFVSHAVSSRHNALAYYTFKGKHPSQDEINKNLTIIFPDLASTSLEEGHGVRLKYRNGSAMDEKFPAGTSIGWVLLVDAYKNNAIEKPCNALYSWSDYNWYDTTKPDIVIFRDRPHMGAFKLDDGSVVLSFEDQPWGGSQSANFRDDVFVLKTNPITAIPDDVIDPEKLEKVMQNGIYLFEDNWPARGDYDLNDVMVKYTSTVFYGGSGRDAKVYSFEHTYTFINNGATFQNAFGFQMGDFITRDMIEFCHIESDVNFQEMGLDPDLNVATFMVFNDGRASKGKMVTMKIKLKNPIAYEDYMFYVKYNPFIVVSGLNQNNRTEVHLRNFKPTAKANMSLFNTSEDLSMPAKGLYYVSNDHYPYALDVRTTGEFRIPIERSPIEVTYPQYAEWAISKGDKNKDWYMHPAE